jgi:hypothetical protein
MKGILGLLLAIQCSACALGGREQPPPLFVNPLTRDIIDCEAEGRRAGNAAEVNCIVKGQQAAGYISLHDLEFSESNPILTQPSPAFEDQAKVKQPGIMSGVEKSRADVIEKMTVTRAGAERLLALRVEEVKKLAKDYRQRRALYDQGQLSRHELEQTEHGLAAAVERVEQDKRWIAETDSALKEMSTRDELLRSPK